MSSSRFASITTVSVGSLMAIMWLFFLLTGSVPELATRPAEIALHLAAEFGTAAVLILSGIASLRRARWGALLLLVGLGMLIYTLVVSPGYYLQRREPAFVAMFAALLVLAVIAAAVQIRAMLQRDG